MNSPNLTHLLDVLGRLQFSEDKAEFNSTFATMLLIFNGDKIGGWNRITDEAWISKLGEAMNSSNEDRNRTEVLCCHPIKMTF